MIVDRLYQVENQGKLTLLKMLFHTRSLHRMHIRFLNLLDEELNLQNRKSIFNKN